MRIWSLLLVCCLANGCLPPPKAHIAFPQQTPLDHIIGQLQGALVGLGWTMQSWDDMPNGGLAHVLKPQTLWTRPVKIMVLIRSGSAGYAMDIQASQPDAGDRGNIKRQIEALVSALQQRLPAVAVTPPG